jgi:hypothetical protein
MGVTLHPEFGLNPTLGACLICQRETGEILLLGRAYPGQAPRKMIAGPEPCDECRAKYLAHGTLLVENDGKKMSGRFLVMKEVSP